MDFLCANQFETLTSHFELQCHNARALLEREGGEGVFEALS